MLAAAAGLCLFCRFVSLAASAPTEDVPPARQVLILTRALAYDGNLKSRAGAELLIGVLWKPGQASLDEMASTMSRAFRGLGNVKVQGLSLRTTQLTYTGIGGLTSAIENQGIDALYVCPGFDAELPAIWEATRKLRVVTLAGREDYVQRGLTLGVFTLDGKPTIVLNLAASKAEGSAFGSDLLRLAKVIR